MTNDLLTYTDRLEVAGLLSVLALCWAWAACGGEAAGRIAESGGEGEAVAPALTVTRSEPRARSGDRLTRLLALRPPPPERADSALRTLGRGIGLQDQGRPAAADDSLAAAAAVLRSAADWIRLGRARAAADAGDTLRVRRLVIHPDSTPSPRWAWAAAVTARDSAGAHRSAARTAIRWAEAAPGDGERSRALLRAGRLFGDAGEERRGRDALRRSIEAEPGADPALEAAEALDGRGELPPPVHRSVARAFASHGEWTRAQLHLERYLEATPAGEQGRGEARIDYARALLRSGRYLATVRALEGVADEWPELAPEVLYLEARARLRYGGEADGLRHLKLVARRHSGDPAAGRALEELASRAEDAGRTEEARRYWVRAARVAETAEEAELRLVRSAALAYLAGEYDSAAALFEGRGRGALDRRDRLRSLYWAALSERAAGRAERARSLLARVVRRDRFSYYGTRAAELLDRPLLPSHLPPGPATPEGLDEELTNAVLRLRVVEALDLDGAVGLESDRLEDHFRRHRRGRYALAEAMNEGGFALSGVRVAYRIPAGGEGINLRLLRARYPFRFREEIRRVAEGAGLSPFLVAGVIRQESLFQEEIESDAGAVGLMQLMPGTGRDLARGRGLDDFRAVDLRSAPLNLRLGSEYLSGLVERYDGNLPYALAAYNAGPSRVSRWRHRPFARDGDVFLEGIPFRQTRQYVKAVLSNTRVYAALYGCGSFEPCLGREASVALRAGGDVRRSNRNR